MGCANHMPNDQCPNTQPRITLGMNAERDKTSRALSRKQQIIININHTRCASGHVKHSKIGPQKETLPYLKMFLVSKSEYHCTSTTNKRKLFRAKTEMNYNLTENSLFEYLQCTHVSSITY